MSYVKVTKPKLKFKSEGTVGADMHPVTERGLWERNPLDEETVVHKRWSTQSDPRDEKDDYHLVSSQARNGLHAPVLDIDLPIRALPSSTPGHYHLYIDKYYRADEYEDLLRSLCSIGLVEWSVLEAFRQQGMTFVRRPGLDKFSEDGKLFNRLDS